MMKSTKQANSLESCIPGQYLESLFGTLEMISPLRNVDMATRNNVDFHHKSWYKIALSLADKVGAKETMRRCVTKQTLRYNHPVDSASDYYKKSSYYSTAGSIKC